MEARPEWLFYCELPLRSFRVLPRMKEGTSLVQDGERHRRKGNPGRHGRAGYIASFTHCATRLRFELNDASKADKDKLDAIPKVMGAVPQGGRNYQVVIGGDV